MMFLMVIESCTSFSVPLIKVFSFLFEGKFEVVETRFPGRSTAYLPHLGKLSKFFHLKLLVYH